MNDFKAYNDQYSRLVFERFRARLAPLLAEVAPDWVLHHMELQRKSEFGKNDESVVISLVIKPLGSVSEVTPGRGQNLLWYRRLRP